MRDWRQYVRLNLRLSGLRPEREAEVVEDLAEQLSEAYEEALQRGLSPPQAEAAAEKHVTDWAALADGLGSSQRDKQSPMSIAQHRAEDRGISVGGRVSLFTDLRQDVRYALRVLANSPGFAAVAVLTLALGIGANTAIFSVFDGMLWRPLPVKNPRELVAVTSKTADIQFDKPLSYPDFLDCRDLKQAFADVTAYDPSPVNLGVEGRPERAWTEFVAGNYFSMLGVKMALGRAFAPDEGWVDGKDPLMVLSYKFWQQRFGGDASAIGRTVEVNRRPFTIIGVAPESFHGTYYFIDPDFYLPLAMLPQMASDNANILKDRTDFEFLVMGRLRPGLSAQQAKAAAEPMTERLEREYPGSHKGFSLEVYPELKARPEPGLVGDFMPKVAAVFMCLVGLVLLIACANVTNLMLARSNKRKKEIATRMALGARPWRTVRQLLTESIIISLGGGVAGLLLARWAAIGLMSVHLPTDLPLRLFDLSVDYRIFAFGFIVASVTGVLAGIVPALRISRTGLAETLNESGRSGGTSASQNRLCNGLVVAQLAISLLLLAGAGFFVRSFQNSVHVDMGFRIDHTLMMSVDPRLQGYTEARGQEFYNEVRERVKGLRGVREAVVSANVPMGYEANTVSIYPQGQFQLDKSQAESVFVDSAQPGYFHTLGVPLIDGREFTDLDTGASPRVAVVNEAFAGKFWPGQNPLGKIFHTDPKGPGIQVVGLTRTGKYEFLYEPPLPFVYFPLAQSYAGHATIFVYTQGDPLQLIEPVREVVRQLDPAMPVYDVSTMERHVREGKALLPARLGATLVGAFGLLGLTLASVGVYGVVAYSVSQRTSEIGIREALGAQRSDVLVMVIKHGMTMAIWGTAIGVTLAFPLFRGLHVVLYGVRSTDIFTLAMTSALLLAVAFVASYVPALRATSVDAITALRHE